MNAIAERSIFTIFQQSYKGKFVQVRANDKDASLLDGFPLYSVDKGKKESKSCFRRPRSPDNMGALDRDLCLFWKRVADANITFLTTTLISFEFYEDQLEIQID